MYIIDNQVVCCEIKTIINSSRFLGAIRKTLNYTLVVNLSSCFTTETLKERKYSSGPIFILCTADYGSSRNIQLLFNLNIFRSRDFDYLGNVVRKGIAAIYYYYYYYYCKEVFRASDRTISPYCFRRIDLITHLIGTALNVITCEQSILFTEEQVSTTIATTLATLQKMLDEIELEKMLFNDINASERGKIPYIEEIKFQKDENAIETVKAIYEYVNASISAVAPMIGSTSENQIERF